jgi:hypothetical protein
LSVSKLPAGAEFRRGVLPSTAANLAYISTKEITPSDISIQNIAGQASGNINSFIEGLYFAGYNGILQGGPKITDCNLYVTDKFLNGFDTPLYFIAKSRYYHLDWPIYISGEQYSGSNITITNIDGTAFVGNYIITVEPYTDFVANGLPFPYAPGSPTTELDESLTVLSYILILAFH